MSQPPAGAVAELNSILRSTCGALPTGVRTACTHDHTGEATAIYKIVQVSVLREMAVGPYSSEWDRDALNDAADEIAKEVMP